MRPPDAASFDAPDVPETQLLLVRHGQSTWNEQGRWQGQADAPLSDLGRKQAFAASRAIGQVDVIASSPLERAAHTAAIISEQIGVGPVQLVEGLKERSAGEWSGLTRDEIEETWPGWVEDGRRPDSYETNDSLVPRVFDALWEVTTHFAGSTVLVVCHGGVIITVEQELNVNESRIPNLHGRVLTVAHKKFNPGERLALVPEELRTGGTGNSRSTTQTQEKGRIDQGPL